MIQMAWRTAHGLAHRLLMSSAMTHRARALVPVLLLAATASIAHADDQPTQPVVVVSPQAPIIVNTGAGGGPGTAPAPVATAPAAPQNADWNDVNHINGQLVKVGETNDYKKTFKRTNVSTNPIAWMYGSYGLSVAYGLNNHIAVRGDLNYIDGLFGSNSKGVEIGVGLPIYFRRTYQGVFLEPGFISRQSSYTCDSCSASGADTSDTVSTYGPQMLVGWHWTWDSGLNVAVAGGIGRNWASENDYDEVLPNGYLRFGYAF
jgi:Protein of unknown function (DUF3575)